MLSYSPPRHVWTISTRAIRSMPMQHGVVMAEVAIVVVLEEVAPVEDSSTTVEVLEEVAILVMAMECHQRSRDARSVTRWDIQQSAVGIC